MKIMQVRHAEVSANSFSFSRHQTKREVIMSDVRCCLREGGKAYGSWLMAEAE